MVASTAQAPRRELMATEILISTIAVSLAGIALGWNIYRDLVSKSARVKVSGMIAAIVSPGDEFGPEGPPERIVIVAVNHGPADVTLSVFSLKKKTGFFGKPEFATVFPDHTDLATTRAPYKLKVGEQAQFVFPFNPDCFLKWDPSHIGMSDVFRKTHWMRARNVKELRSRWCKEFQKGT